MAVWPAEFPQVPLLNGFSDQPGDGSIRNEPDYGPPLTRRRTSATIRQIQCEVVPFTLTSKDALDAWFKTDLAEGSLPFTWAKLSEHTGGGAGEFRFTGPPQYSPLGLGRWRASLTLIRDPGT